MAGLTILVVNAGSTSLKLSVVADDDSTSPVASLSEAPPVDAAAHRVVHGGPWLREPVVIDDEVRADLERASELAPLHNRPALEAIDQARAELPDVPHVAVFDTAFHSTIPEVASTYALPRRWREEHAIRRYGFHGLSVAWSAERVRVPRLVVCHLGGGCSVTAVKDGRSVDTTMGFTPLEGVPMATRPGSIDPEILLYLLRRGAETPEALEQALQHESGLLALGGIDPGRGAGGLAGVRRGARARASSATGSPPPWRRWLRRWAGWTHSCSPPGSGRDQLPSVPGCAHGSPSSASGSTRRRTTAQSPT